MTFKFTFLSKSADETNALKELGEINANITNVKNLEELSENISRFSLKLQALAAAYDSRPGGWGYKNSDVGAKRKEAIEEIIGSISSFNVVHIQKSSAPEDNKGAIEDRIESIKQFKVKKPSAPENRKEALESLIESINKQQREGKLGDKDADVLLTYTGHLQRIIGVSIAPEATSKKSVTTAAVVKPSHTPLASKI